MWTWALTWEESSAMRWRAAYSIMYQRQRFKNSWGSLLCLVLSACLSLCMSSHQSVHCDGSRFATPVGSWCLVKLSSCLRSLFLSLRTESLSVLPLLSFSEARSHPFLLSFFLYTLSVFYSVDMAHRKQIWPRTNLLLTEREGHLCVCMCLFEGHLDIQCLPVSVHTSTVLLHPWGMREQEISPEFSCKTEEETQREGKGRQGREGKGKM